MIDFVAMPSETDPPSMADAPFHCPADDKRIGNNFALKWPEDHSEELKKLHATGLLYSEIAIAINAKFGTSYTRNSTIGRGNRMGFVVEKRREPIVCKVERKHQPYKPRLKAPTPATRSAKTIQLRCTEIVPRMIPLIELERGDCRFPFGDGPQFLFCGLAQEEGSSWCPTHKILCRDTFSPAIRGAQGCRPSKLTPPEVPPGASHGIEGEGREASHQFKRNAA